jgi:hypothetical protein
MLIIIMLSVTFFIDMLSVIMLIVIILRVIMLNAVMLSVVSPYSGFGIFGPKGPTYKAECTLVQLE